MSKLSDGNEPDTASSSDAYLLLISIFIPCIIEFTRKVTEFLKYIYLLSTDALINS